MYLRRNCLLPSSPAISVEPTGRFIPNGHGGVTTCDEPDWRVACKRRNGVGVKTQRREGTAVWSDGGIDARKLEKFFHFENKYVVGAASDGRAAAC